VVSAAARRGAYGIIPSEPERSGAASTSVVSAGSHPKFEQSDMRAGSALSFAVENSVVNGGSKVSDPAISQVGPNQRILQLRFDWDRIKAHSVFH